MFLGPTPDHRCQLTVVLDFSWSGHSSRVLRKGSARREPCDHSAVPQFQFKDSSSGYHWTATNSFLGR